MVARYILFLGTAFAKRLHYDHCGLITKVVTEHDEIKINELSLYKQTCMVIWSDKGHIACDSKKIHCQQQQHANNIFSPKHPQLLKIISFYIIIVLESLETENCSSWIRQVGNWLRNIVWMDILGDLAISSTYQRI